MNNNNVVIVDDDRSIRVVLSTALSRAGFNVKSSGTSAGLWNLIKSEKVEVLITDVGLPDGDTLDFLPKILKTNPDLKIIVISARSTLLTAVRAEKKGALYYLPKPFDLDEIINLVSKIIEMKKLDNIKISEKYQTKKDIPNIYESGPIIGKSKVMQDTFALIARLVSTRLNILINGEIGTGKKLLARSIHDLSENNSGKFINLNLSDVVINKKATFDLSFLSEEIKLANLNGGTVFVEDICNATLVQQSAILNFIESNDLLEKNNSTLKYKPLRIIASSSKNIPELIENGKFREDLFYKINVVPINLPPLRKRTEDIPLLVDYFLKLFSFSKENYKYLSGDAIKVLLGHEWSGNVSELRNIIERVNFISSETIISSKIIKKAIENNTFKNNTEVNESIEVTLKKYIENFFINFENNHENVNLYDYFIKKVEKPLLETILTFTRGNQIKASELLGFNRNTLRKKIKNLAIEIKKVRKNS